MTDKVVEKLNFYTLLYVDLDNQSLSRNGIGGDFDRQMKTFVGCALSLSKSLAVFTGCKLTVLTNNKSYLSRFSTELNYQELTFSLKVKLGVPYFSAHFKLDVFRHLASLEGAEDYHVLLDSDMLCVNPIPENFKRCIDRNVPVYYDITALHIPAYTSARMIGDKEKVMEGETSNGMWAGGEFIGGTSGYFRQLVSEIDHYQDRYFEVVSSLFHQGDEVLLSVAIEQLLMKGVHVCELGRFGAVARYWTFPTRHVQNKWKSYKSCSFLHLPSDKRFLKSLTRIDENLLNVLSRYVRIARMEGRIKYFVLKMMRRL